MVDTHATALGISGLTDDEANYVYNVEVLGLPPKKAAALAGMTLGKITSAHVLQAREGARRTLRGATAITKDDIVYGYQEAIHRARLLDEPMTEIVGWEKIAKLLGYDAAQRVDVHITASVEALRSQVKHMTDADLVRMVGADSIIDADFYVVPKT